MDDVLIPSARVLSWSDAARRGGCRLSSAGRGASLAQPPDLHTAVEQGGNKHTLIGESAALHGTMHYYDMFYRVVPNVFVGGVFFGLFFFCCSWN